MKITIEPTTKIVRLQTPDGGVMPARIWEGTDERGTQVHCYITRIAIAENEPPEVHAQFAKDLQEQRKPTAAVEAIPLRLII